MNHSNKTNRIAPHSWSEIAPYAFLSGGCFVGFLVLVGLMLLKVEKLAALGLTGNFYYLLLVPLGLAAAGILFGALRSYAKYKGKQLGGTLELGGPAIVCLLVIILGFWLPRPSGNFPITVYVHGSAGPQDLLLRSAGYVLLDLGGDRRREPIGENGQAFFSEIPPNFRGQRVNISLDDPGYEMANPGKQSSLDSSSLYLEIRKKPAHVTGRVQNENGEPLSGANIRVADATATTDASGRFNIVLASAPTQDELSLQVLAPGYLQWNNEVIQNSNEIVITLKRKR